MPPMINRELFYVARDRIELPTQGFSVPLLTEEKIKISDSLPPEGIGKNTKNRFKEITRKALKNR